MTVSTADYYAILGLTSDATLAECRGGHRAGRWKPGAIKLAVGRPSACRLNPITPPPRRDGRLDVAFRD
jgi:hypothetical protein